MIFYSTGNRPSRADHKARLNNLLYRFYFHQVLHSTDHTQYLRSGFYLFGSMHLLQTERLQGQFLTLRPVDTALDLCDLDLCHDNLFAPPLPTGTISSANTSTM